MIESLGHLLNKNIVVSIPSLFEDDRPRECTLSGIEVSGVWLEGLQLAKKHPDLSSGTRIFVPFAQVQYLMDVEQVESQEPVTNHQKNRSAPKEKRHENDVRKTKRSKA